MNAAELATIDLNLLHALHALLQERHVTRAARRAHVSQSAMSRSLNALRALFKDELLVRVGQTMKTTPRADALVAPLEEALVRVRDLMLSAPFDPRKAGGTFRLAAIDIVTYMLIPDLLRVLAEKAPEVDVQVVQWNHRFREHLESGEVDLTMGQPIVDPEPGLYSRLLVSNPWACVLRRDHPALSKPWTRERYAKLSHVLIDMSGRGGGHVDEALARHGLRRRIALRIPYVVLSPLIVAETDLVVTTALWLARKFARHQPLAVKPPPIKLRPVDIPIVWHERTHRDPRHRWFRETLLQIAAARTTPEAPAAD